MLPKVILHNEASIDGRMDNIEVDMGRFYGAAMSFTEDATLVGSNTMVSGYAEVEDDGASPEEHTVDLKDKRPIVAVVDSRGRFRKLHLLRREEYWRDAVALVSKKTPKVHLKYLEKYGIPYITKGEKKVDLRAALEELRVRYKVKKVRADCGGTLNGVLLRAGLVDEVSLIVNPSLVGGRSPVSIFIGEDLESNEGAVKVRLTQMEKLKGGAVWLRYKVRK